MDVWIICPHVWQDKVEGVFSRPSNMFALIDECISRNPKPWSESTNEVSAKT